MKLSLSTNGCPEIRINQKVINRAYSSIKIEKEVVLLTSDTDQDDDPKRIIREY